MGEIIRTEDVILLLDHFNPDSQNLCTSFRLAGKEYPTFVIEEDGFLPEYVASVYGYFLGEFKGAKNPGKPLYFNQIKVPEFWEISGNNQSGKIHNMGKERGRIYYAKPEHKRLVRIVDWLDEKGVVRSSDHYNKYGACFARTIFNAKGQKVNKSYFSAEGKEIIVENFVTGDIIVNDADSVQIFRNKTDFILYFLKRAGYEKARIFYNSLSFPFFASYKRNSSEKRDVLFWQEPVGNEIPGNMKQILEKNSSTCEIVVQKRGAYERLMELGAPMSMVHLRGFIYPFQKENGHKPEALICTNSDQIEQCFQLVTKLPDMNFHIVALTEMSSKLMSMGTFENVHLYPGVKMGILNELFAKCDYYFDINHGNEIVSAVRSAFLYNHLIFAFQETVHNRDYVAKAHIYASSEVNQLMEAVKETMENEEALKLHLTMQQKWAMAEPVARYDD